MKSQKFFVYRHPEFHRRIEQDVQRYDKTDYDDIVAVIPYRSSKFPQEHDYNRRRPSEDWDYIRYDHSITQESFSGEVPDVVLDILEIATATFAADKAVSREIDIDEEKIDDSLLETRNIKLQIPVLSPELATEEVEQLYSEMVSHMTRDIVEYEFHHIESIESVEQVSTQSDIDAVGLLSDGLDSAAGIYHNKSEGIDAVHTTIDYGQGVKSKAENIAGQAGVDHRAYRVKSDRSREYTQFSRGLLHLSFAVSEALAVGTDEIHCFENGIMARFLILSDGWMTTRTVSPQFLAYFNGILSNVLEQPLKVENPFRDLTKTEITEKIPDKEIVKQTVSCPHSRWAKGKNCGLCIPCLVRNVGIIASSHEIAFDELSEYNALLEADFEEQSLDFDVSEEGLNPSASSPEVFFKGVAEIAFFCRRVLEDSPRQLASEYSELLDEPIFYQHHRFAENFVDALGKVASENPTVRTLLPDS
ncbi:7-cyano-7-deazaguanine synthase [Halosimplex salinum]|uniref:7-cyano-7-deazaguanine synthase n=1 Tax=Halosimplex salinum TaxID=1710538 RepID=UPI000F4A3075|nr:7-cyano-7-deazaguanine synthase [Halosimplex salinum]